MYTWEQRKGFGRAIFVESCIQDEVCDIASSLLLVGTAHAKQHGFLEDNGNGIWIIGSDVWNMAQE